MVDAVCREDALGCQPKNAPTTSPTTDWGPAAPQHVAFALGVFQKK